MNVGEIATNVVDRMQGVDALDQFDIVEYIDKAHATLHRELHIPEALNITAETFTWATTDGTSKDVNSELTGWRGRPHWITEGDDPSARWVRLPLLDLRTRQLSSSSDYIGTGRYYAVQGDYLLLVAAPSSDIEVSVIHYQEPDPLIDDADEPTLDDGFHGILIEAAERDAWFSVATMETSPTMRNTFLTRASEAQGRYMRTYNKLVAEIHKQDGVRYDFIPGPIWRGMLSQVVHRRQYFR